LGFAMVYNEENKILELRKNIKSYHYWEFVPSKDDFTYSLKYSTGYTLSLNSRTSFNIIPSKDILSNGISIGFKGTYLGYELDSYVSKNSLKNVNLKDISIKIYPDSLNL
jgi:hypothetical protein